MPLDDFQRQTVLDMVRCGDTVTQAALIVGQGVAAIWAESARDPIFHAALQSARLEAEDHMVRSLRAATSAEDPVDWRDVAWADRPRGITAMERPSSPGFIEPGVTWWPILVATCVAIPIPILIAMVVLH